MDTDLSDIKGHVMLVMAPMGSGKGTIITRALADHPDLYETVSCTSRQPRPGEIDGKHYYFLTSEEFDKKIADGDFLEWAEFAGNKYGTLKSEIIPRIKESQVVILEIELQGVKSLLEILPRDHMTIVYIEAGGWEVLKARAIARAPITEEALEARYKRYLVEEGFKEMADVVIDNSESVEVAHKQFEEVLQEAYNKCK